MHNNLNVRCVTFDRESGPLSDGKLVLNKRSNPEGGCCVECARHDVVCRCFLARGYLIVRSGGMRELKELTKPIRTYHLLSSQVTGKDGTCPRTYAVAVIALHDGYIPAGSAVCWIRIPEPWFACRKCDRKESDTYIPGDRKAMIEWEKGIIRPNVMGMFPKKLTRKRPQKTFWVIQVKPRY